MIPLFAYLLSATLSSLPVAVLLLRWHRRRGAQAIFSPESGAEPGAETPAGEWSEERWRVVHWVLLPTGAAGMAVLTAPSPQALLFALLLFHALYCLSVIDLSALEVELSVLFGALALRLVGLLLLSPHRLPDMLLGMLSGAGLLFLTGLGYQWLRGRVGLGEGDAAVMALSGAFVGLSGMIAVLLLSALSGLIIAGGMLLLRRRSLATPIPMVPFLAVGTLAVYFGQASGIEWWGFSFISNLF